MPTVTLKISDLTRDPRLQLRVSMTQKAIENYAEDYEVGMSLPRIEVYQEGAVFWLVDGFHRVAAKERLGHEDIEARVTQGTFKDALLAALSANQGYGLRRTEADKRRVVLTALQVEEWANWSDRQIAEECGVSDKMVAAARRVGGVSPQLRNFHR